MITLKGHGVLVTGSSKGVGRAIAEACASVGADVVLNARGLGDEAREAIETCRSQGVSAEFIAGDLSGPTEQMVDALFEATIRVQPHTDILINNAGQFFDLPFEQMALDRFEKTLRLNVTSGYFLTQRFARHWMAHKTAGRVLFIGSVNGRLAEGDSTAYDISKGAIEMMVKTLSVALAPHNIRVNGMAPGLVRTPQTRWLDREPHKAQWITHHTPNGQIPPASACGAGAVYLVSDEAYHVHGHMLMIDGGMSAWQQPEPM